MDVGHNLDGLRRRSTRLAGVGLGGTLLLGLSGCSSELGQQFARVGMVPPASDRAPHMLDLWVGGWIAAGVIGLLTLSLILYPVWKFRRRPGNTVPLQTKYHIPLEVLYTSVPFLIIVGLFFFTVKAENRVLAQVDQPDHTIGVIGQKWSWTFNYNEKDNAAIGVDAHEVGTVDRIPELYLPLGESVRFNITAADVDHSFWVPAFYFKMDAIPGHPNSFDLTPTKLGSFDGKCAELCGTYHAAMLFTVKVVTPEEYNAQVKKLAANGNAGIIAGPAFPSTLPTAAAAKEEEK